MGCSSKDSLLILNFPFRNVLIGSLYHTLPFFASKHYQTLFRRFSQRNSVCYLVQKGVEILDILVYNDNNRISIVYAWAVIRQKLRKHLSSIKFFHWLYSRLGGTIKSIAVKYDITDPGLWKSVFFDQGYEQIGTIAGCETSRRSYPRRIANRSGLPLVFIRWIMQGYIDREEEYEVSISYAIIYEATDF